MKNHSIIIFLILISFLTACENNEKTSSQPISKDMEKKVELESLLNAPQDSLSMILCISADDWPLLFVQENENQFKKTYARITWHTNESDQLRLNKQEETDPNFSKYLNMYREHILPAKSYSIKQLIVERVSASDKPSVKGYKVSCVYELTLSGETKKEVPVQFVVDENAEVFSSLFNVDGLQNHTLPELKDPQAEAERSMTLSLVGWRIHKLSASEIDQLLK